MRLYLSSFDIGNCPEAFVRLCGANNRTGLILNALDNRLDIRARFQSDQTAKLTGQGLDVSELDLRDYFGDPAGLKEAMAGLGAVWITGGNTFILRQAMRASGFDEIIRDRLDRDDIVYGGFSAAAVILWDDLTALIGGSDPDDVPENYPVETVWEGLKLLPFAIVVHFQSDHPESEAMNEEIVRYEAAGTPYRTLRDGEALLVDGDRMEIVG